MMNSDNIRSQIVLMVPARAAEIMFIMILVTSLWLIRRVLIQTTLQLWLKWCELKAKITLLYFLSWKNAFDIFLTGRMNIHSFLEEKYYRRNRY